MKKQLKPIEKKVLKWAIYTSLLLMMISQNKQTVGVYLKVTKDEIAFFGYCFSIAFDVSIAIFILVSRVWWAAISSLLTIAINIIYFGEITFATCIIAFIMAGMVVAYSVLTHDDMLSDNPQPQEYPERKPRADKGTKRGKISKVLETN